VWHVCELVLEADDDDDCVCLEEEIRTMTDLYAVDVPEYECYECGKPLTEEEAQDEDRVHMIGDRYYHAECCPMCRRKTYFEDRAVLVFK